jgi:hypothetical protein
MLNERAVATLVLALAAPISVAANIPESLIPSANEVLSLETRATGVQIYTCSARRDDPYKYEWTLSAPEAELRDTGGKRIGRHYAGPTWESDDGSKVIGEVKARDDGPDASAIPWLLLVAKSNSGNGVFAKTTSIQRLDTVGGKAPADGCGESQAGRQMRVPYTATYLFFSPR